MVFLLGVVVLVILTKGGVDDIHAKYNIYGPKQPPISELNS